MRDVNQTDFYRKVYDDLYEIGYHGDPNYSHAYGLIKVLSDYEFSTIIDIGASVGAAVSKLNAIGKNAIGLEASLVAVNLADRFGRSVMWGEATKIPFPSKHIDVVMSTDMLEHLKPEDVDLAIQEFHRVAKKYIALKIGTLPEQAGWGKRVGVEDLHLTVQPIEWWITKFTDKGGKVIYHEGDTFVIDLGNE